MKKIAILVALGCLLAVLVPVTIPSVALGMTGSGTPGDPYVIYNYTDLEDISNDLSAHYLLNNNITCSGTWSPLGTFTGSLDGDGYTIIGLNITETGAGTQYGSFFLENYGNITNIAFTGLNIWVWSTSGNAQAHLINENHGIIEYCSASGSLYSLATAQSGDAQASMIGLNEIVVSYCSMSGDIEADGYFNQPYGGASGAAGLVLVNNDGGNITRCVSTADIVSQAFIAYAGGLVLVNTNGSTAEESYATGTVLATGGVSGLGSAGGFCQQNQPEEGEDQPAITNCYAMGNVTATGSSSTVGGFCQHNTGNLTNAYSIGYLTAGSAGGFLQAEYGLTTACFWDTETSGEASSAGGTGKTTAQMNTSSTFTAAGWDFDDIWGLTLGVNDNYPYFEWVYGGYDMDTLTQVVWFQPNDIISGTTLPNRATGSYPDGTIVWGDNPAGISIALGDWSPEDEYDFDIISPGGQDIIRPTTPATEDVDLERLRGSPLYPLVQILTIDGFLNERLVWIGLAWLIVIGAMFLVHIGPDTHRGSKKPHHFILTTVTGLGLSIIFYVMGIFAWPVILGMALGLVGGIIWERQPVI